MRFARIIGLGLLAALILASCGWLGGLFGNNSGLVRVYTNPTYDIRTERVEFRAAIQFPDLGGRATPTEYRVLDGATVVSSQTAEVDQFGDVLKLWKGAMVSVAVTRNMPGGSPTS